MTTRRVSAVTFDLWDTLIQERPGGNERVAAIRVQRIKDLFAERGIIHSTEEIEAAYQKTGAFLELTWSKHRDMSLSDQMLFFLSGIDSRLAGRLSKEDFALMEKAYAESILESPPVLLPNAKEAVRAAKQAGYRVGLISNTGRTPGSVLRTLMGRMGVLEYFDVTTFSNEVLVRKPAEGVFRTTLRGLRVAPKAAVHVGDDPRSDIEGAKAIGMKALQVVRAGKAKAPMADGFVEDLDDVLDLIERL